MRKKAFLAASITLLFISIPLLPVSAQITSTQNKELPEATIIEKFMNEIECYASESPTFDDFVEKLQELGLNTEYKNCTITQEFILKMIQFLLNKRGVHIGGIHINDLLGILSSKFRSNYFVISYGVYNRINPWKENSIDLFKERLSIWRYSNTSAFFKGRTLILERHPFRIHQKLIGPQVGLMKGFKGIYIDIESKLTSNTYVVFIGRVDRIRAFDLTPLKR